MQMYRDTVRQIGGADDGGIYGKDVLRRKLISKSHLNRNAASSHDHAAEVAGPLQRTLSEALPVTLQPRGRQIGMQFVFKLTNVDGVVVHARPARIGSCNWNIHTGDTKRTNKFPQRLILSICTRGAHWKEGSDTEAYTGNHARFEKASSVPHALVS